MSVQQSYAVALEIKIQLAEQPIQPEQKFQEYLRNLNDSLTVIDNALSLVDQGIEIGSSREELQQCYDETYSTLLMMQELRPDVSESLQYPAPPTGDESKSVPTQDPLDQSEPVYHEDLSSSQPMVIKRFWSKFRLHKDIFNRLPRHSTLLIDGIEAVHFPPTPKMIRAYFEPIIITHPNLYHFNFEEMIKILSNPLSEHEPTELLFERKFMLIYVTIYHYRYYTRHWWKRYDDYFKTFSSDRYVYLIVMLTRVFAIDTKAGVDIFQQLRDNPCLEKQHKELVDRYLNNMKYLLESPAFNYRLDEISTLVHYREAILHHIGQHLTTNTALVLPRDDLEFLNQSLIS